MQTFFNILTCLNSFCLILFCVSRFLTYNKLNNFHGFNLNNLDLDMWSDVGVVKNVKKDKK